MLRAPLKTSMRAYPDNRNYHQLLDEAGDGLGHGRDFLDSKAHVDRLGRLVVPISSLNGLHGQRFNSAHAMHGFDQERLAPSFRFIQCAKS